MISKKPRKNEETPKDDNALALENENINEAYKQAEEDIQNDPELSVAPEKGDDLDEGELAKLEGEE